MGVVRWELSGVRFQFSDAERVAVGAAGRQPALRGGVAREGIICI